MRLTTAGRASGFQSVVVGVIATRSLPLDARTDRILVSTNSLGIVDLRGYAAIITSSGSLLDAGVHSHQEVPVVTDVRDCGHFADGHIVMIEPASGFMRTLYRPESLHNTLFMTERCNSNCLMCSQPPKDRDDVAHFTKVNLNLIRLITDSPRRLGITGGEPTLLGEKLFEVISCLRDRLPKTHIHMLTNGRIFSRPAFARALSAIEHPALTLAVPLYSDYAVDHDHIVQASHAFDQTLLGLYNLAAQKQRIEIRVVLHRLTIPRLAHLAEFIARNLPFAEHVALMGLEPIGFVRRNTDLLWIDPEEYQDELESAVEILSTRGMAVSVYNQQLCVLRKSLWPFARKAISDWKNVYIPQCEACSLRENCGGLFKSAETMHSRHIRPL